MISITIPGATLERQHCVYTVTVNGVIIFAATSKLSNWLQLEALRSNSEAAQLIRSQLPMTLTVVSLHNNATDAETALSIMLAARPLHCNTNGKPIVTGKVRGAIRCIQTGEVYRNSAEAARCNGIAKSVLSEHLNGRYTTAGGKRFERIMQ